MGASQIQQWNPGYTASTAPKETVIAKLAKIPETAPFSRDGCSFSYASKVGIEINSSNDRTVVSRRHRVD
jgi:hypothetical protein